MSDTTDTLIRRALEEWMSALDVIEDPIFTHDREFRILRCNRAYQRLAALPFKEIIGRRYYEIFPKMDAPFSHCLQALIAPDEKEKAIEIPLEDAIFRSRGYAVSDEEGRYSYSVHILEDITRQRENEEKLKESEAFIKAVLDNLPTGIAVNSVEPTVTFSYMNDNFPKIYRTTREKLSKPDAFWEAVYEDPVFREEIRKQVIEDTASADAGRMNWIDIPITREGEETTYVTARNVPLPEKKAMISMVWDVTERKRAEKALKSELNFSGTLIESLPGIFFLLDEEGKLLRWNHQLETLYGLPPETMLGINALDYVHEEDRARLLGNLREALETGSSTAEARMVFTNGIRTYALTGNKVQTKLGINVIGIGIDITRRKQDEAALKRANRALKTLSAGNLALVRAKNEDELLKTVTEIIVTQGEYDMSSVCYAQNDPEKTITPVMWAGNEELCCSKMHLSLGDNEADQLPIVQAIRTSETQICRDIRNENAYAPWKEALSARGFISHIALPLIAQEKTFGTLNIYSKKSDTFNEEEVRLLEELANDLAYGIISQRTRAEHEQHAVLMRQSLEQSIQAIAATLEARDPYTAGHQRRVSDLATAIAREMGLPPEQIEGIRFAAMIHDLGKIHIPAEILAKPSRLSDIEYMLIKTHPQEGYNILKEVRFPWPIADIILQHHEREDGSGYPNGLKSDQILLEAKIICVADVMEAMSSHRPYRPGLGVEPALEEIMRGRGSLYAPSIVDACLKLFREERFIFSEEL